MPPLRKHHQSANASTALTSPPRYHHCHANAAAAATTIYIALLQPLLLTRYCRCHRAAKLTAAAAAALPS
jgi:hypothetical protein